MELHYKKEHMSCTNYKTEAYNGFGLEEFVEGTGFSSMSLAVKANFLIFILEGEMLIAKDQGEPQSVAEGQFLFMPFHADYEIQIRRSGRCIYMSFFYNDIQLCDKFLLESYWKQVKGCQHIFRPLPVREPLTYFLGSMRSYLEAGVNCKHLHALKEKELFIILRTSYTKEEVVNLFYPILGRDINFKGAVISNADKVESREELAALLNMSVPDLARKFNREFGEPVYSWLMKQKKRRVQEYISLPAVSIKDVIHYFNFSSPANFNRYCKQNFGCAPTELFDRIRKKRPE